MGTVVYSAAPYDRREYDWQVPPFTSEPSYRVGWIEECIQEGEGWLAGQRCYLDLTRNLKIFDAVFTDKTKSLLLSNGLKYDIRKFVETISEVREIGSYMSDAKQFQSFAEICNKVAAGIYLESAFPRQIRKTLQFATVLGRGYCWPKCKAVDYGWGERRIVFEPLGPLDVVPVQVPSSTNDVQDAYAVTVYTFMPIAEAHARFPLFQSQLQPVSASNYDSRVQARRADFAEFVRYGQQSRNWGDLYCEIRYTFVRDLRINVPRLGMPGFELPMGDPDTTWFYKVPYVGQSIFAGIRNGAPFTRPAMAEDCRIYPFLRLLISSRGMTTPMYDGPAFDWHGQIPTVQYDVDDWAWEGMGRSLVQDVGSIEQTKRKIERKVDQVITVTLNPPMGYDRSTTGGPKIENFDIFEQDQRIGLDGKPAEVLQSVLPEEVRVTPEHFAFLDRLDQMRQKQLGLDDLANLANLKMNLSGDNIDRALEPVGPIAKGIAAGMEAANAKIAFMLKFQIIQWFDTARIIEYIGPDYVSQQILDFDPTSLVPSHMPEEYVDAVPPSSGGNDVPSFYPQIERARRLAKSLRLISVPSTLLRLTQQEEQLKWMSLKFKNAPISWSTVLKKLGIENYGDVPGNTEREKWMNEQMDEIKFQAEKMQAAAQLGILPQPDQPPPGPGRPPTGQKPLKVEQKGAKGGEPRIVNSESG